MPDIAFDADSLTGVPIVYSAQGGTFIVSVGGTSVGSPDNNCRGLIYYTLLTMNHVHGIDETLHLSSNIANCQQGVMN